MAPRSRARAASAGLAAAVVLAAAGPAGTVARAAATGASATSAAAAADVVVPALDGTPRAPLAPTEPVAASVLLFVMTDCPISNRYAPEVRRIHEAFGDRAAFWLVYVDADRPVDDLREHRASFGYPFEAVRDVAGRLAAAAGATVTPEVAVYDGGQRLVYRGRIDDRFVSFGVARAAPATRDLHGVLARLAAGESPPFSETRAIGCYISGSPSKDPVSGGSRQ